MSELPPRRTSAVRPDHPRSAASAGAGRDDADVSKVPRAVTPAGDQHALTEESSSPFSPVVLHDGTSVGLEPMQPGDEARLDRFHHTLSSETTQKRFFAVHPQLSDQELHGSPTWTISTGRHMVAVHDSEIIGVGRLDRLANGGEEAEVAFVVADAGRGEASDRHCSPDWPSGPGNSASGGSWLTPSSTTAACWRCSAAPSWRGPRPSRAMSSG